MRDGSSVSCTGAGVARTAVRAAEPHLGLGGTTIQVKARTNLTSGIIFLVLGIVIVLMIPFQVSEGFSASQYSLGSRGLPYLSAIVMIAVSLIVIVRSLVFKVDRVITIEFGDELRALGFYGIILGSVLLMEVVGFLISGLLVGWSTLLYIRSRKLMYYVYVGGFAAVLYFLFVYALNINLPAGILFGGR